MQELHRRGGKVDAELINTEAVRDMTNETYRCLSDGIEAGIAEGLKTGIIHEISPEVVYALKSNTFIFCGLKSYHTLSDAGLSLTDEQGVIKPFHTFLADVQGIHGKYNAAYLNAEYKHAIASSQMASKWQEIETDGDRYDLQYRTAGDDKVRADHAALNGVTLPASDPFWDKYYPPNGWGCRCTAVQVCKGKYQTTLESEAAIEIGDMATSKPKEAIFRTNAGKVLKVYPDKHPYNKAPKAIKREVERQAEEKIKEQRIEDIRQMLPDNLTEREKTAKAANNYEIEKALGITIKKPMTVEEADKQSANPAYVPKFLLDPNGVYRDKHARYRLNPDYNKQCDEPNSINCQTCAPAYALRIMGLAVTAKPNTPKSKLDYLSRGMQCWETWKNIDGTPAKHTSMNSWLLGKGYKQMSPKRYLEFFDEVCKDTGIYELSIGWKGGGGHATILQRFSDGKLRYIEPQADNSIGSGYEWKNLDYLANMGASSNHECRGIMRIDNKLFNIDFIDIFNK